MITQRGGFYCVDEFTCLGRVFSKGGIETSDSIDVGGVYDGKVVRLKPFGAIVSLPDNTQGLVHISHISHNYVQNVEDHLVIGDMVRVKVIAKDSSAGKISLSMKEIQQPELVQERSADKEPEIRARERIHSEVSGVTLEDKIKEWVKISNERQAGLNKRNKRR
jgi:predicted RNA-binding protein with RPS1 domain